MSYTEPPQSAASAIEDNNLVGRSAPKGFLFAAAVLLALVFAACWRRVDSSDLLFHLRAGKVITDTGQVPNRDIFSAASSVDKWSYIEWLWAGVLSLAYTAAEFTGLNLLNSALAGITVFLLLRRCRNHGSRWFESVIVTAFVMIALLPVFQPEPALAVLPLFVLALVLGEGRRLWPMALLPGLALLWANVHAAFLLPLLVPLGRLLFPPPGQDINQPRGPRVYLAVLIAAGLLAGFITPHSVYIAPALAGRLLNNLAVFLADPLETVGGTTYLIRALAAVAMIAVIGAARLPLLRWQVFTASILAVFCLITADALNFLLVFLAAPAAAGLTLLLGHVWVIGRVRNVAALAVVLANVAVLAVVLMVSGLSPDTFGSGLRPRTFPETAAGRLTAIPLRASILNPPDTGGYLIWRLWPNWKVCLDNRSTLYSPEFREDYEKLWAGGAGWESRMTLWRVSAILGTNDIMQRYPDQNLFHELAKSTEWVAVLWDSSSILYVKEGINLAATNLSPFRQLKPGLAWPAMKARIKNDDQWRELMADLRRALMDDPTNGVAQEFLRRAEEETAEAVR